MRNALPRRLSEGRRQMWPIQRGARREAGVGPVNIGAHLSQVAHSARARSKEPQKVAYSAWRGQQSKVGHEGRSVKHWFSAKRDELFALNWPLLPGVACNRPHWVGLGRHSLGCRVLHARASNSAPDQSSRPKWSRGPRSVGELPSNKLANMFTSTCSKAMLLQMSDNRLVDEILVLHPQVMAGVL